MNQEVFNSFMRDVIADKKDDSVRLIFADWLEEEGEVFRAEFIRLQIELHKMKQCHKYTSRGRPSYLNYSGESSTACMCDYCTKRDRTRHIVKEMPSPFSMGIETYGWQWAPLIKEIKSASWNYSRGFVGMLKISESDWVEHKKALAESHPLELVELFDCEYPDMFVTSPFEVAGIEFRVVLAGPASWTH